MSLRIPLTVMVTLAMTACWTVCAYSQVSATREPAAQTTDFEAVLSNEQFARRFADALGEQPSIDELENSPAVIGGRLITEVIEGSQADRQGVKPGWVLHAINGNTLPFNNPPWPRKEQGNDTAVFIDPAGKRHTMIFQPGIFGMRHVSHRRLDLWHIRHGQRDPRWDDYVIVGTMFMYRDPELAETAWRRALDAGYEPDDLSRTVASLLTYRKGQTLRAYDLMRSMPRPTMERPELLTAMERLTIAVAAGDMSGAIPHVIAADNGFLAPLRAYQAMLDWPGAKDWRSSSPSQFAADMSRRGIMNEMVSTDYGLIAPFARDNDKVFSGRPFSWSSRPGNYRCAMFKPETKLGNFEWSIKAAMSPTGRPHPKWWTILTLAIYDSRRNQIGSIWEGSSTLAAIGVQHLNDGATVLTTQFSYVGGKMPIPWPSFPMDGRTICEIKLIRVRDRIEVRFNDTRIVSAPFPPAAGDPVFMIHSVGLDIAFEEAELFALSPRTTDAK